MIDTDVAIHLADGDELVLKRIVELPVMPVISAVTRVELEGGVYKDPAFAELRRSRLNILLGRVSMLPFDERAAVAYGGIVAALGYSRRNVSDRMIAAHAISIGAILVTMNARDFRGVPLLALDVWPSPARSKL